jgi:hypothetical protein
LSFSKDWRAPRKKARLRGEDNIAFLRKRFEALSTHHSYHGMEYTDDRKQMEEWFPLVMEGRDPGEKVAATRNQIGTLPWRLHRGVDYDPGYRAMFCGAIEKRCLDV